MNTRPRILFVTGMHRSGTSAIASQLVRFGGVVPDDLLPATEDNSAGFFESDFVVTTNEKILELFGSNWRDPSQLPFDWLDTAKLSPYYKQVTEFLAAFHLDESTLILKDPRFSRLLPFWLSACEDQGLTSTLLVITRDPISVARSLWVRNHIPSGHALQLWCRYYIDLYQSLGSLEYCAIEFDEYIRAPQLLLQKLDNLQICNLNPSDQKSSIERELVHHQNPVAESRFERGLQEDFNHKPEDGLISEQFLQFHYAILGGDFIAVERRHYGTVAMILDTVIEEKNSLSSLIGNDAKINE